MVQEALLLLKILVSCPVCEEMVTRVVLAGTAALAFGNLRVWNSGGRFVNFAKVGAKRRGKSVW